MKLTVQGKNLDVGQALSTHIEETLTASVTKYFNNPLDAVVTMSKRGREFVADVMVHAGRDITVQGGATAASDAYAAFDAALARIDKQLRRYKRRLRDHRRDERERLETQLVQQYILAGEDSGEGAEAVDGQPAIIAEMETPIATLTVGEAVMRMDLADLPALMFRNSAHGGLNVVYRRGDGNVGWIDPRLSGKDADDEPAPRQA